MSATINYTLNYGVYPITVSIFPFIAPNQIRTVPGTYSFTNVPDGNYILTFTDSGGCVIELPANVMSTTPSLSPSNPSRTPSKTPTKTPIATPDSTPFVPTSRTPSKTPSKTPLTTPSITPLISIIPSRTPSKTPSVTPSVNQGNINLVIECQTYNNSDENWGGVVIIPTSPTDLTFRNNSITANTNAYLLLAGNESPTATDNYLDGAIITGNKLTWTGTVRGGGNHAIMVGYNINDIIKYNYLDKTPYGVVFKSGTDAGTNMTYTSGSFAYNIVRNSEIGVRIKGMNGILIYNNTFYDDLNSENFFIYISSNGDRAIPTASTGTKIKNNIFYSTTGNYMIYVDSAADLTGFESDYNIYYTTSGSVRFIYLGSSKTFAEWQALGYDTHSVVINPNFINTTGLVPTSRLDYGTDLGSIWQYGLSTSATWVVCSTPSTTSQNGTWQVGAIIHDAGTVIECETYTNSNTGTWDGVNISRSSPIVFTFRNNSITSVNSQGYQLQAGDEGPGPTNNNLDGEVITGNQFIWNGTDVASTITHALFVGYNINCVIKYNYLYRGPTAMVLKSNGMTYTSGGVAYNIINRTGCLGIAVKGMDGVKIYNNTLYTDEVVWTSNDQPGMASGLIDVFENDAQSVPSTNTTIRNNIFYTKHQVRNILIEDSGSLEGFSSDYNVFYCEDGDPMFGYPGEDDITFAQWQAHGYDLNSVVLNPNFKNFTDFVPGYRLDYGIDLGDEWKTGLSTSATWDECVTPLTEDQNGTVERNGRWQVGARIYGGVVVPVTNYLGSSRNITNITVNDVSVSGFSFPITPNGETIEGHTHEIGTYSVKVFLSGTSTGECVVISGYNEAPITTSGESVIEAIIETGGGVSVDYSNTPC